MSGVAVVRYLLANNAQVLAAIPAMRIKAGQLPQGTVLPAIVVDRVSDAPRLTVAMTEPRLMTERVQVSWIYNIPEVVSPASPGYPGSRAMDALILDALPNQRGTINGFVVDSILPAEAGPDLELEDGRMQQSSRDFIVKWIS